MSGGVFSDFGLATTGLPVGYAVTGASDVDKDGFADLIVLQHSTGATFYAQEGASGFVRWGVVTTTLGAHVHAV
jgi:hypothetical protein